MPYDAEPVKPRGTLALPIFAAIVLFACAYANSWRNSFHFDDSHVVETNPAIRSLSDIPHYFTDARTFSSLPANQTYRPIVTSTLAIDYAIARITTGNGFDPRPYHVTQLLLLALVAALLGGVAREVYARATDNEPESSTWVAGAALVSAAWFAVHAGNTQVGNYISARSESLSVAGVLGGLLLFMRGGSPRYRHAYLIPMALGALSKTPAVLLAPLLLIWSLFGEENLDLVELRTPFGRARAWRAARRAIPALVAAVALYVIVEGMNPPEQTYGGGGRPQNLWTQLWVSARYIGMFFLPTGLSADSDWSPLPSVWDIRVFSGLGLLALSAWVVRRTSRTRLTRPIGFGIMWFWIALLPSFAVPLAEVTNDHRPFLAFAGLTMAVVWSAALFVRGAKDSVHGEQVAIALSVIVLSAHAFGTHLRNRVWRSEATLWADVARTSPGNARGLMNYALTVMRGGRFVEARALLDSAALLAPSYPLVYVNIAIAANAQGDTMSALAAFRRALALDPGGADAHHYYARWLADHGRARAALVEYERAISARPAAMDARRERLLLLVARGDRVEALPEARAMLALDAGDSVAQAIAGGGSSLTLPPDSAGSRLTDRWYKTGWSLTRAGRHAEAIQAYREAVAADSTNSAALNNLGWSLGLLGYFDLALPPLERAVALAPTSALARSNLAWARAMLARTPTVAVGP